MASITRDEKASQMGPLSVNTTELPAANLTPVTTKTEKGPKETSIELSRATTVSSPTSVHQLNPFDTDVEALAASSDNLNRKSTQFTGKTTSNPNCTIWPGQEHWKQKARAAKIKNRSCQCMSRLSPRNRLIAKILIAILIIGIAVAVGLGISKPLGAGIWKDN